MGTPVLAMTAQSALLSIVSSVLAQVVAAHQANAALALDWRPILQWLVFSILSTPPNVMWQVFLEQSFPGYESAAGPETRAADKTRAAPAKPRLRRRNTLAKTLLDQSLGASLNTLLLCAFVGAWEARGAAGGAAAAAAAAAAARVRADFWPLLTAGWRFWPWVSLGSFALVPDVPTRNLVGSLAGVGWGVYISLATA